MLHAEARPGEPTKRFHTLAAITNLLLLPLYVRRSPSFSLSLSLSFHVRFYLVDSSAAFEQWERGCVGISSEPRPNVNTVACVCVEKKHISSSSSSRVTHAASYWDDWGKLIIWHPGQEAVLWFIFSTDEETRAG